MKTEQKNFLGVLKKRVGTYRKDVFLAPVPSTSVLCIPTTNHVLIIVKC